MEEMLSTTDLEVATANNEHSMQNILEVLQKNSKIAILGFCAILLSSILFLILPFGSIESIKLNTGFQILYDTIILEISYFTPSVSGFIRILPFGIIVAIMVAFIGIPVFKKRIKRLNNNINNFRKNYYFSKTKFIKDYIVETVALVVLILFIKNNIVIYYNLDFCSINYILIFLTLFNTGIFIYRLKLFSNKDFINNVSKKPSETTRMLCGDKSFVLIIFAFSFCLINIVYLTKIKDNFNYDFNYKDIFNVKNIDTYFDRYWLIESNKTQSNIKNDSITCIATFSGKTFNTKDLVQKNYNYTDKDIITYSKQYELNKYALDELYKKKTELQEIVLHSNSTSSIEKTMKELDKTEQSINRLKDKINNMDYYKSTIVHKVFNETDWALNCILEVIFDANCSIKNKVAIEDTIFLSKTEFSQYNDFKQEYFTAEIYYEDGSWCRTLIYPDNANYLSTAAKGKQILKWHNSFGSYESEIYIV